MGKQTKGRQRVDPDPPSGASTVEWFHLPEAAEYVHKSERFMRRLRHGASNPVLQTGEIFGIQTLRLGCLGHFPTVGSRGSDAAPQPDQLRGRCNQNPDLYPQSNRKEEINE